MPEFDMPRSGTWEQRGGWVVRALARDMNFTLDQAAGLVGNLGYESRGFTAMQEEKPLVAGAPGGFGWAQWTAARRREFERWCMKEHLPPASDEANYGFLLYELRGDFAGFATKLKRARTLAEASRMTHEYYERPADVLDGSYRSGPDRLAWAQRALAGARAPAAADSGETVELDGEIETAVKLVQTLLGQRGIDPGPVDGIPGKRTVKALETWQAAR